MTVTPLEQDVNVFKQAASGFGDRVWLSRDTHVACRAYLVGEGFIDPGATVNDVAIYNVAIAALLEQGKLPVKPAPVKTAEEIQLEEDRKNFGVVRYEEQKSRNMTAEYVQRDPIKEHNDRAEAALQARRNPQATRREQMDNLLARTDTSAQIPGLKDEHEQVYVGDTGRISHYRTQIVQQQNKEHNARVRAEHAQRQAAATAANSTKKGL
jgi:hypothetical protein